MPSLTQLVADPRAVLLVDSSSATVTAGLLRAGAAAVWRELEREAGIAIFEGVAAVLAEAGLKVRDVGAFVFCEGPGSILGIRTAAMALRSWQAASEQPAPAFSYRSLELLAHDLHAAGTPPPFAVLADARRDAWHWVEVTGAGVLGPLQRIPASQVAGYRGGLFLPEGFRNWSAPPRPVRRVNYAPAALWPRHEGADLLRPSAAPDAFLHEASTYAAWTPQIHRAPRPESV
jgi:tRNA threonylcarbamoyladenosine biosynthesis protein TsaB